MTDRSVVLPGIAQNIAKWSNYELHRSSRDFPIHTKMRSGHFENGEQIGEWTTYDKNGQVYKVTNIKPKKKDAYPPLFN